MKKLLQLFLALNFWFLGTTSLLAQTNSNHVYVNGYTKANGTYVEPYYRTAPNSTNQDNFSTVGNVNPYTGQPGYVPADNNAISTSGGTTIDWNNVIPFSPLTEPKNVCTPAPPIDGTQGHFAIANLNLRSGMGTEFDVIITIPIGAEVMLVEQDASGWWYVFYAGNYGYASSKFLSL